VKPSAPGLQRTASGAATLRDSQSQGRGAAGAEGWAAQLRADPGATRWPGDLVGVLEGEAAPADETAKFFAATSARGLCRGQRSEREEDRRHFTTALMRPWPDQVEKSSTGSRLPIPHDRPGATAGDQRELAQPASELPRWGESQGKAQLSVGPGSKPAAYGNTASHRRMPTGQGVSRTGVAGSRASTANFAPPEQTARKTIPRCDALLDRLAHPGRHAHPIRSALGHPACRSPGPKPVGVFGQFGLEGEAIDLVERNARRRLPLRLRDLRVKFSPTAPPSAPWRNRHGPGEGNC